jgi:hypothetical protein
MSARSSPFPTSAAAEAALDVVLGSANQDATFSLALSHDQKDIRDKDKLHELLAWGR